MPKFERCAIAQNLTPVVFTMGKVASTSVSEAILASGANCYDIHNLNKDALIAMSAEYLNKNRIPLSHICISMAYRQTLFSRKDKCLYITLVRDPVERNLSAFFHQLHRQPPEILEGSGASDLFQHFLKTYNHGIPIRFFDTQFKAELGIDVYAHRLLISTEN